MDIPVENVIRRKKMKAIYLKNFGVIETNVPKKLLFNLKKQCNELINKSNTEKMNSALVGNKPLHIFLENTDELFKFLEIGLKSYDETFKYLNSFKILNKSTNLIFGKPWVNVQKDNEYIPNHIHDGIYAYSIWVDIPYKTIFEFSYSNILGEHFREQFFIDKKYEGKMFFFPAKLVHCTYTLEKSKKNRLCISGHISFNN
jgi:hypothetical protein